MHKIYQAYSKKVKTATLVLYTLELIHMLHIFINCMCVYIYITFVLWIYIIHFYTCLTNIFKNWAYLWLWKSLRNSKIEIWQIICCDQNHMTDLKQLITYHPKLLTTWNFKKPGNCNWNYKLSKKQEKERTLYQNPGGTINQYREKNTE